MKKGFIIGFSIFAALVAMFGVICFLFIRSFKTVDQWTVYGDLTGEQKEKYSYMALLPEFGDSIDRYGIRGFRDAIYQVESPVYANSDEMIGALPESWSGALIQALENDTPEDSRDVEYYAVKCYAITEGLPLIEEKDVPDEYKHNIIGCFWDYMILEYPDGTCRFAVEIKTT